MQKLRALLANHLQIMRELVGEIVESQSNIGVGGLDPRGVLFAAKETRADVVVIALKNAAEPGMVSHLLQHVLL